MRIPYMVEVARRPQPALGGRLARPRPMMPVEFSQPGGSVMRTSVLDILIVMHLIPRVGGWTSGTDRSSPSSVGNSSDRQHSPYRPPPPEPVVCRKHSRSM